MCMALPMRCKLTLSPLVATYTCRFYCLTPDDFTRQRETPGGERVKKTISLKCWFSVYPIVRGRERNFILSGKYCVFCIPRESLAIRK